MENLDLGLRLQTLRQGRGVSLRELARQAGLAPSFLSRIERNQTSPSISSLQKICKALRMSFSDVLRESPQIESPIIAPLDRKEAPHAMRWGRAYLQHIQPPEMEKDFTSLILTLEVGGEIPLRSSRRSIIQLTMLLSGVVEAHINGEVFLMESRKALFFDINLKHGWKNVGHETAEILMVHPYHFELFEQEDENLTWSLRKLGAMTYR